MPDKKIEYTVFAYQSLSAKPSSKSESKFSCLGVTYFPESYIGFN